MNDTAKRRETSAKQPRTETGAGLQARLQSWKVRQGETSGHMRKVVVVSTLLAVAAMLGIWWYFVA
jgi:cobalamin biosynthesis Mg chelatase CobN